MIRRYESYNDSDVEWIGEVPSEWSVNKLKYVTEINPKKDDKINPNSEELVTFLPMEKVGGNGEIDCGIKKPISDLWTGFTFFKKNDVILAKITPCFENGKCAYLNNLDTEIGFGSTEFHVLRAKKKINPAFLFYVTRTAGFMQLGEASMTGAAGQKRVPTDFITEFYFAFPNVLEQTVIVDFLDRKTAEIDKIITLKEKLVSLYEEEKREFINHAVTRGLDQNVKLKPSGLEWLGDIPEHWGLMKLKYVCNMKSGDGITSDQVKESGDYPVYGGNGIRGNTDSYTHEGEYVLIGRQGALCGNINYAVGKFWATEHAIVCTLKNTYLTKWLGELLRIMNLNQYSVAAAQPGLSIDNIKVLQIPIPPPDEQANIVVHIETQCNSFDAIIEKFKTQIHLFKEYRKTLITEVVTGKINITNEVAI